MIAVITYGTVRPLWIPDMLRRQNRCSTCHTSVQAWPSDNRLSQVHSPHSSLLSSVLHFFNICPACKTHAVHSVEDHDIKYDFKRNKHILTFLSQLSVINHTGPCDIRFGNCHGAAVWVFVHPADNSQVLMHCWVMFLRSKWGNRRLLLWRNSFHSCLLFFFTLNVRPFFSLFPFFRDKTSFFCDNS